MTAPFKRIATVDIGSNAIRLLLVHGQRIERWATAYLEPGLVEYGLISDPPALGAQIKHLMQCSGITARKVVASITGLFSVCRILPVAEPADQPIGQAIIQAARQIVPLPPEDIYLSWQIISQDETGVQAFVVGMPRAIVDAQVRALRSAGLKPYILNLKGMALAKLIQQRDALIVNMEPDCCEIVLMVDGVPQIMRSVIPQHCRHPEDRVEHLAQEVGMTTRFYRSRSPNGTLNGNLPLYLAGGLAQDPEVAGMVRDRIHYPYLPLAIPLDCPSSLPVSEYAVNIGVALRHAMLPPGNEDEQQDIQP